MIIPGIIVYALVNLGSFPEGVYKLKTQAERNNCLAYNMFKKDVERRRELILSNKVPYLSWYAFVRLKEDDKILELENQCNEKFEVDRK